MRVSARVNAAARMNFANTVLGNNVALCTAGGSAAVDTATTISFLNTFSLGSGTLTKDGQGIVAFESANNTCGSIIINGGTVEANGVLNGPRYGQCHWRVGRRGNERRFGNRHRWRQHRAGSFWHRHVNA